MRGANFFYIHDSFSFLLPLDNKTLPKAQRTRGLSSSNQSNLMGHITIQSQIMIKFLLQNLDQALTSKSQPNISISSQTNCREISDGVSESVSDKGSQCRQLYQLFFQRRKSFSPYKSCLNFNFKVLTKPCAQSLNKS